MGLCLATAVASTTLAAQAFTLAWTHSIEKQRWEEDWLLRNDGAVTTLVLARARVRGHGAGMEPPEGAVLRDGVWQWAPGTAHARLRLTRSIHVPDYDWCVAGACRPLAEILPSDGGVTEVWPCALPAADGRP